MAHRAVGRHYGPYTSRVPPDGGPPPKEELMRLAILKRSGVAGVASVVLTAALVVGLAQNASAKANPPNEARTLEGTWWVQVTALTDCVSHVPLMSFTALLTFAKGGTMTGTTTNPAFAIGQRSPDHGVWFRSRAAHTYKASSVALLLFGTAPNFPATPGFQAGSHRLTQAIDVNEPDHFTSDAVSEFFDVGGNKYREGCATAIGQRFE
jgi:hypothetical protein